MDNHIFSGCFPIEKGDFVRAGEASSAIKRTLRQLGVSSSIMRRVAVAAYEAEMNLIIHSLGGQMEFQVSQDGVLLVSRDVGPGIPDISMAMKEGYSTASEEIRMMGFGAGMGLPNMQRNCDRFDIQSRMGEGTVISMEFKLQ
ncbi:anti-sigma regulatory factor [Christensenella sp. MSJ-20]|uniref:ATP-binding protein n=1 Tax=Christensenella sp. MSJ-20 TaxID=2841518 RepID=UPI000D7B4B14|nr:MAG: anti-sigma regulatory factor [Bacillota bacterium]QWT55573.1 anti-sigma regulatory factor [Christensenella sp. MSJ-20]